MVINIEDIIEQTLNNLAPSEWQSGELKARLDTMQQDFANSLDEKQREMYTNLQNTQAEYDSTHTAEIIRFVLNFVRSVYK